MPDQQQQKKKKLTINDEFECFVNGIRPDDCPPSNGDFETPGLCESNAHSPANGWHCTNGYSHTTPHIFANEGRVYAVWREQPE